MATATRNRTNAEQEFEAAAERVRALNEQIIENSKQAGQVYLDLYEKTLTTIAEYEEKLGGAAQVDWIATLTKAQADFTREMADAYTSAARRLLS